MLYILYLYTFREAAAVLQRQQADEQHARQLQTRQAELDADVKKTKDEEETRQLAIQSGERSRRLEFEHREKLAEIEAKQHEEEQKNEVKDIEWKAKIRLEEEKTKQMESESQSKKEQMEERSKQLELECALKDKEAALQVKLAQERTKQVKVEAEQKRKGIEAVERTKQLAQAVATVTTLADIGTDKATINALLWKMLGGETPLENLKKNLPPASDTTAAQFENKIKDSPKVSQRRSERRVFTAPVFMY